MTTRVLQAQDKYTQIKQLGRGAMGQVVHVTDGENNYAMKILGLRGSLDDEQVKWFIREAEFLQSLNHPGIPKVKEWFYDPTRGYCMVMEFVDGETVETIRLRRKVSEREVVEWTLQVLSILEYLHEVGRVIHRDLKPSNIMLDARGKIWLIDLGVANKLGTGKGTAIGSLGYFAPEQVYGTYNVRTDLFALGMIMRTLLTGQEPAEFPMKPFDGTKSQALCAVVTKATQFDASFRYGSAKEMKAVLSRFFAIAATAVSVIRNDPDGFTVSTTVVSTFFRFLLVLILCICVSPVINLLASLYIASSIVFIVAVLCDSPDNLL